MGNKRKILFAVGYTAIILGGVFIDVPIVALIGWPLFWVGNIILAYIFFDVISFNISGSKKWFMGILILVLCAVAILTVQHSAFRGSGYLVDYSRGKEFFDTSYKIVGQGGTVIQEKREWRIAFWENAAEVMVVMSIISSVIILVVMYIARWKFIKLALLWVAIFLVAPLIFLTQRLVQILGIPFTA